MTEYNGFGTGTPSGLAWQDDSGAYTMGQRFRVDSSGLSATKVRFYIKSGSSNAPLTGYYVALYEVGNTTALASAGPFDIPGLDQWHEHSITPQLLSSAGDYVAAVLLPGGYYGADTSIFSGGGYDPAGPLNFYDAGVFNSGSSLTYPGSSFGAPWYGIDVAVDDGAGGGQTVDLGVAGETDAALALTVSRSFHFGVAAETDAALSISHSRVLHLGAANETDAVLSLSASRAAAPATVYVVQAGSLVECTVYTSDLL